MKINLSTTMEILLVILLIYILVLRGTLPEIVYQSGLVSFIIFYFLKKYTQLLNHDIKIPLPEYFDFLENLVTKEVSTKSKKLDKVEKFLSSKTKTDSLSYSDLSDL
jgi:hypothetical protein